jgi:hypothetical protein
MTILTSILKQLRAPQTLGWLVFVQSFVVVQALVGGVYEYFTTSVSRIRHIDTSTSSILSQTTTLRLFRWRPYFSASLVVDLDARTNYGNAIIMVDEDNGILNRVMRTTPTAAAASRQGRGESTDSHAKAKAKENRVMLAYTGQHPSQDVSRFFNKYASAFSKGNVERITYEEVVVLLLKTGAIAPPTPPVAPPTPPVAPPTPPVAPPTPGQSYLRVFLGDLTEHGFGPGDVVAW